MFGITQVEYFVCGGIYHPGYGYDTETGYSYPLYDVKVCDQLDREWTIRDFWSNFEISKSQIAHYLSPKWLGYLEDNLDTQLRERTLYIIKHNCIIREVVDHSKPSLPKNDYISESHYGAIIKVFLPNKARLQNVKSYIQRNQNLDREYDKKCILFINGKKIQELEVNSLIPFLRNYDWSSNKICYMIKLARNSSTKTNLKIENKETLLKFLQNLYMCYRKIEVRLGYNDPNSTNANTQGYERLTYDEIADQLDKSMEDYRKMDLFNVSKMHPIIKSLFKSYQTYIKYSLENKRDIMKGDMITSELLDKIININEKLITINSPVEVVKYWNRSNRSLIPISRDTAIVEKFRLSIFDKVKVLDYVILLSKCVEMIESKLTSSGLEEIPKYGINQTITEDSFVRLTSDLRNIKNGNIIDIYPVVKVFYEMFCIHINPFSTIKKDVDLIQCLAEETLEELINRLENWTVIHCGKFILSEPYGWYTFDKKIEPLNSSLNDENKRRFVEFLINLYKCYTKMEIKLNDVKYDKIYEHKTCENVTYRTICKKLDKAIEEFRPSFESNLLDAYSGIKKLYCCYIEYLNYSVMKKIEVDEGDTLPGTSEELKEWMKKLDSQNMKKHDGQDSIEPKKRAEDENGAKSFIKKMLLNQLQKHQNQHDDVTNRKIDKIINLFKEKTEFMSLIMEEIKNLNLDGDTNELVDMYYRM